MLNYVTLHYVVLNMLHVLPYFEFTLFSFFFIIIMHVKKNVEISRIKSRYWEQSWHYKNYSRPIETTSNSTYDCLNKMLMKL